MKLFTCNNIRVDCYIIGFCHLYRLDVEPRSRKKGENIRTIVPIGIIISKRPKQQ